MIYGANYIIAKDVMPHKIGPSAFVFLRVVGAIFIFWGIRFFIREKVARSDMWILVLCGLLGVAMNQLLFFNGLNMTSPIDASIIITAIPVLVLIFSAIILKEKITRTKIYGLALGGIGAVLLVWYGKDASGTTSMLGNLFVFLNACSYGLYLVIVKPLMKRYSPITIISWVFLFGFLFVAPIGYPQFIETDFSSFTTNTYLSVAYVIIGTTFLAYLFNIFALKHVPPIVSGSYVYLQPAVSFIMVAAYSAIMNSDKYSKDINMIKILSCVLVILGVFMISRDTKASS